MKKGFTVDNRILLVKCITLLYRESQLAVKSESSNDLIRTGISQIQTSDLNIGLSSNTDVVHSLKDTVIEMCNDGQDHEYDKTSLLQRVKLGCGIDDKLYESIEQGIELDLPESSLKRTVINLRKSINNHFREEKIQDVLAKAAYAWKFKRDTIKDPSEFIMQHIAQLEPLQMTAVAKDPAIISEVDIGDVESSKKVFEEMNNLSSDEGILKCGFQGVNRMLQGGFRRGESVRVDALQHKYKTGFTLSLFGQFALFNKPFMIDATKKPLLVRISFEDELTSNLKFLYQYLKVRDGMDIDHIPESTTEEMSAYIKDKLQVNGYHFKMIRVDPGKWTYLNVCNKIIEYEAQGYEVHACMLDYLSKLPTTGCSIGGPMGSDHHDLHNRMRNFFSVRRTLFITPHQFSSEANQLVRNGTQDFVKQVVGLNYQEKCKTLEQIPDLSLAIHIEKFQKKSWLTIQRGKHRNVDVIPEELMYCTYLFPKRGPILDDINGPDMSLAKVGGTVSNTVLEDDFASSAFI